MTVLTDNFNRADESPLGTSSEGWSWAVVINGHRVGSNKTGQDAGSGTSARTRAESDLASSNHYAQAVWADVGTTNTWGGLCLRFASGADTCYYIRARGGGSSTSTPIIHKVVGGTESTLATGSTAIAVGDVLRFEVENDQLVGKINGVTVVSVTDASISGGIRTGLYSRAAIGAGSLDDFQSGDLASGATDLVIQDGAHAHVADSLALTQAHNLTVQDAGHGHTADALALTQVHNLAVQDAAHAHTADNVVLGAGMSLVIADGLHAHTADNLSLTQVHNLAVADGLHAHAADSLALTQVHALVIADAAHGHLADNVVLSSGDLGVPVLGALADFVSGARTAELVGGGGTAT